MGERGSGDRGWFWVKGEVEVEMEFMIDLGDLRFSPAFSLFGTDVIAGFLVAWAVCGTHVTSLAYRVRGVEMGSGVG